MEINRAPENPAKPPVQGAMLPITRVDRVLDCDMMLRDLWLAGSGQKAAADLRRLVRLSEGGT